MPTPEELATVLDNHRGWVESGEKPDDQRRANLCQANLAEASLVEADLQRADLVEAKLQQTYLRGANLQGARLVGASVQRADLYKANLQNVNLHKALLQEAWLEETSLQGAWLVGASLAGVVFEPLVESLPDIRTLITPHARLDTWVFHTSPAVLITLREAFKNAGLRTQERQLTYAVEHTKMLQAWDPSIIEDTWGRQAWLDVKGLKDE